MSTRDSKVLQGKTCIPLQLPATHARASCSNFPPQYEAQVNDNLRNFGELEGQIGASSYHQAPTRRKRDPKIRKYQVIIAMLAVALLGSVILAVGFATNKSTCPINTQMAESAPPRRDLRTTVTIYTTVQPTPPPNTPTSYLTETVLEDTTTSPVPLYIEPPLTLTTTSFQPTTLTTTTTASAWIPSFPAEAPSSPSEEASSRTSEQATPSATSISSPAGSTVSVHSSAESTATSAITKSTAATSTLTAGGRWGFCGPPGSPCLGG